MQGLDMQVLRVAEAERRKSLPVVLVTVARTWGSSPRTPGSLVATVRNARAEAGLPPPELKEIPQAAATSVWAAVVAEKDVIGGRYLEDCAVAPVVDVSNPFADGVRSYALDGDKARQLWARSEELLRASA
jgi:XdhC and CoxI family